LQSHGAEASSPSENYNHRGGGAGERRGRCMEATALRQRVVGIGVASGAELGAWQRGGAFV
jgi:hypothetical protein